MHKGGPDVPWVQCLCNCPAAYSQGALFLLHIVYKPCWTACCNWLPPVQVAASVTRRAHAENANAERSWQTDCLCVQMTNICAAMDEQWRMCTLFASASAMVGFQPVLSSVSSNQVLSSQGCLSCQGWNPVTQSFVTVRLCKAKTLSLHGMQELASARRDTFCKMLTAVNLTPCRL